jgi:hypothetical protein
VIGSCVILAAEGDKFDVKFDWVCYCVMRELDLPRTSLELLTDRIKKALDVMRLTFMGDFIALLPYGHLANVFERYQMGDSKFAVFCMKITSLIIRYTKFSVKYPPELIAAFTMYYTSTRIKVNS